MHVFVLTWSCVVFLSCTEARSLTLMGIAGWSPPLALVGGDEAFREAATFFEDGGGGGGGGGGGASFGGGGGGGGGDGGIPASEYRSYEVLLIPWFNSKIYLRSNNETAMYLSCLSTMSLGMFLRAQYLHFLIGSPCE